MLREVFLECFHKQKELGGYEFRGSEVGGKRQRRQQFVPERVGKDRTLVSGLFPGREVSVDQGIVPHRFVEFGVVAFAVCADEALVRLEGVNVVSNQIVGKIVLH